MRASQYVLGAGLAAVALLVAAPSAHAVTFTFAEPSSLMPASSTACFNGNDVCGTTLSWTIGSLSVTASSMGTPPTGSGMAVIQDRYPDHGGLGVVYRNTRSGVFSDSAGDEVNGGQTLVLTFNQAVVLSSLTFFDEAHNLLGASDTFNFAVGAGPFSSTFFSDDFSGTQGTVFSFRYGGETERDFYLASASATSSVPEPATLGLLGMGLLAMVGIRRRRP